MKIAIYSRKSKFTGKGESVQNQIEMCKSYADNKFESPEYVIYEDEGFSGGNTDRPQFQLMLKDAKQKKFQAIICYRLDRISRNVSDFSTTLDELNANNISFISITEQFDTSTPIGRAMTYIASVFAQLERETIAERIRDNMIQLAKTGRWLGGTTPTGYGSEPITLSDKSGKERKAFKLSPITHELDIVKLIYSKYLELKSITKTEQYCLINNFKSKNNTDFQRYSLRFILANPVYAIADKRLYDYFIENGYEVYSDESEFDGLHGIMPYNRTRQAAKSLGRHKDITDWIIAVGAHSGIISSDDWIGVQRLLLQNKSKSFRKVKSNSSLLSGILRCGNCGSFMRPKMTHTIKGVATFYYMCELKERSKRTHCSIKNINGVKLDKFVVDELIRQTAPESQLYTTIQSDKIKLQTTNETTETEISLLKSRISDNEKSIENLVTSLSQGQETTASKYILDKITLLDSQNAEMKKTLLELRERTETSIISDNDLDMIKTILSNFKDSVEIADVETKRSFLKVIIEKLVWDGENIHIHLFGTKAKNI